MYSTRSTAIVVVVSVLVPFASVFVALRFKVRMGTIKGLGLDDYTMLMALVVQYVGLAVEIYGAVAGGEGDSARNLLENPSELSSYAKVQYIGPLVFATSIALIKTSTLILYKRIFVTQRFQFACHVMMAVTAGWFLTSIFGEIFSSKPVSKGPKDPIGPFTINYVLFLLSMAAINMVLDAIVVSMPLSVIQNLRMSSARKAQVSGIFLLGLFCIIAATVRVYYLRVLNTIAHGPNTESEFDKDLRAVITVTIWFEIEAQISIIAACLPTLAPLLHTSEHPATQARTWRSIFSRGTMRSDGINQSFEVNSAHVGQASEDDRRPWEHLKPDPGDKRSVTGDGNVELSVLDVV